MTTVNKKELMNEVYDAALVTSGVVVLSMALKRFLERNLPMLQLSRIQKSWQLVLQLVPC